MRNFKFLLQHSSLAVFTYFTFFFIAVSACSAAAVNKATPTAAARFIDQSSFGPTPALIQHVEQIGLSAYLTEQLSASPYLLPAAPTTLPSYCQTAFQCVILPWQKEVLLGNDQLRQRVALALSEIFTVSFNDVTPTGLPMYYNILSKDAFANYKTLMKEMTLDPAMGQYLNMAGNYSPKPGQIADENYARELMQLMSLGTCRLDLRGVCQTYGGNEIPVYTQDQIQALARALTGWNSTYGAGSHADMTHPMVAIEKYHDQGAKTLIDNVTLPAGQTAEKDLDDALSVIFADDNVPPFVSKLLIQHLVSSNPSGEYVARVATVFQNNGKGVRGDLSAVVAAILTDQEARAGDTAEQLDGGHLREPILWLTGILRGLGAVPISSDYGSYNFLAKAFADLGEVPFRPSTVFSFYSPSFEIPGADLLGPEFQLETASHVSTQLSIANALVYNQFAGQIKVDMTAAGTLGRLAAADPGALVDSLGVTFLHSRVDPHMKQAIVALITPMKVKDQVANATYLVITSPQYKVVN